MKRLFRFLTYCPVPEIDEEHLFLVKGLLRPLSRTCTGNKITSSRFAPADAHVHKLYDVRGSIFVIIWNKYYWEKGFVQFRNFNLMRINGYFAI